MSKEAYTFENINGKTAYLVGVVDTLCDEYLVSACPQYTIDTSGNVVPFNSSSAHWAIH